MVMLAVNGWWPRLAGQGGDAATVGCVARPGRAPRARHFAAGRAGGSGRLRLCWW